MTPFETQLIALITPLIAVLTTLVGLYVKDRIDKARLEAIETARIARAAALDELGKARAETLAAQAQIHASELLNTLDKNTAITIRTADQTKALAEKVGATNGEPQPVKIVADEPVPVKIEEPQR